MEELTKLYVIYVGSGFLFILVAFLLLINFFAHQSKNKKK